MKAQTTNNELVIRCEYIEDLERVIKIYEKNAYYYKIEVSFKPRRSVTFTGKFVHAVNVYLEEHNIVTFE